MLKLIQENDPILKQIAVEWNFEVDGDPVELEKSMIELMSSNHGRGLAANQIGLLKRVFAIKLEGNVEYPEPFAMFNPRVLNQSSEYEIDLEGCLSFPNLWLQVKRPSSIEIEFFDKDRNQCIITLSGINARCFLHELDHLNGVCFTDKVSQLKLNLARKKQRKYNGRTQR